MFFLFGTLEVLHLSESKNGRYGEEIFRSNTFFSNPAIHPQRRFRNYNKIVDPRLPLEAIARHILSINLALILLKPARISGAKGQPMAR
jgi:hypothetical protein